MLRDELVVEKIKQAVNILDEIDTMIESQSTSLQQIDYELSDYYHLIENQNLSDSSSIKVVKRIKELRKIRRSLSNENSIESVYQKQKNKMIGNDTRQFLMIDIRKKVKELDTKYKNRILTDKQIKELLEEPKKKRGRPKKNK